MKPPLCPLLIETCLVFCIHAHCSESGIADCRHDSSLSPNDQGTDGMDLRRAAVTVDN